MDPWHVVPKLFLDPISKILLYNVAFYLGTCSQQSLTVTLKSAHIKNYLKLCLNLQWGCILFKKMKQNFFEKINLFSFDPFKNQFIHFGDIKKYLKRKINVFANFQKNIHFSVPANFLKLRTLPRVRLNFFGFKLLNIYLTDNNVSIFENCKTC